MIIANNTSLEDLIIRPPKLTPSQFLLRSPLSLLEPFPFLAALPWPLQLSSRHVKVVVQVVEAEEVIGCHCESIGLV